MMKQLKRLGLMGAALLFITACSSVGGAGGAGGVGGTGGMGVDGGNINPHTGVQNSTYYDADYGQRGTADRIIYFDFDSDRLRRESYNVAQAHAEELKRNPNRGMFLEGHTDDRGSHEYNMGLGERRAKAVRDVMVSYGVNPAQLRVRSYGKELPAVSGYDEGAWAQNRRVELVY